MRRIDKPAWAGAPEFSIGEGIRSVEWSALDGQISCILSQVHEIVQGYINNPDHAFDAAENLFPSRGRLTGEYYIASQSCHASDESWFERVGRTRQVTFSVMTHCLELALYPGQVDRDYLGLEIDFIFEEALGSFVHHGDVNSSSI